MRCGRTSISNCPVALPANAPGGGYPSSAPEGRTSEALAELRVLFVGGTAFVKDRTHYTAVQMSGIGASHGHHKHSSFIIAPKNLLTGAEALEENDLHPELKEFADFEKACLVGKDVLIANDLGKEILDRTARVAHFGHIASGWKRREPWTPGHGKPVNSRFTLIGGGSFHDGDAVNTKGAAQKWYIKDSGMKKSLTDVLIYCVAAPTITISGLNASKIVLENGRRLSLYVFSGPLDKGEGKYKVLKHASLLTAIYDVGQTPIEHILPTSDVEVERMEHLDFENPCGHDFVPPDSDFCVNYDELP